MDEMMRGWSRSIPTLNLCRSSASHRRADAYALALFEFASILGRALSRVNEDKFNGENLKLIRVAGGDRDPAPGGIQDAINELASAVQRFGIKIEGVPGEALDARPYDYRGANENECFGGFLVEPLCPEVEKQARNEV